MLEGTYTQIYTDREERKLHPRGCEPLIPLAMTAECEVGKPPIKGVASLGLTSPGPLVPKHIAFILNDMLEGIRQAQVSMVLWVPLHFTAQSTWGLILHALLLHFVARVARIA